MGIPKMRLSQPARDPKSSKIPLGLGSVMFLLLGATPLLSQGIIATVAGNGSQAFAGDGDPATAAALNHPCGLAIDSTGAIYIADTDNARIRRVSPGGIISTVAGDGIPGSSGDGGSALHASLSDVAGVALDAEGNFYFGDASNRRVRKVTPGGIITTVAGTGRQGFSGDGGPATNATLNRPTFVLIDPAGKLYIADSSNQRIRRVDVDGTITTIAGNGVGGFSGDGGLAINASLAIPLGLAMDKASNLYIADANNHRIRKVSPAGIITTVAGNGIEGFSGDLGPAARASLNYPEDVAFDGSGNMYIADSANNRIRKVDPSGVISTIAGTALNGFSGDGGPSVEAMLDFPWAVATDAAGGVYIADRVNNRIRKISSGTSQPTLVSNSVRSVANGAIPNPPGSLIYVQGANLASATTQIVASATPLLTHLQNTVDDISVTVDGTPVPMYYALPNYVAFQLPWETGTGTATLVVTRNGVASTPLPFSVSQFSPGIYTTSGNGIGMAWAIFAAPSKINPKGQVAQGVNVGSYIGVAATKGDVLYIYAGGLGRPTNAQKMMDGQAPCPLQNNVPGPCPASYKPSDYATATTPVVLVGGVQATGITSILDPTYPGLYLVFFTIPSAAPKGNAVPIQLQIPGGPSTDPATVTIAIQ
jgi:uncharacterized protein (TIGR03437 family)